jgi:hypothetical protein
MLTIEELEKRMRPGQFSVHGFLGKNEKLEDVLNKDEETLRNNNLTYEELSAKLNNLVTDTVSSKMRSASIYPYKIDIELFKGFQICPWTEDPHSGQCAAGRGVRHASINWEISNQRRRLKMSGPGLIIHLIRDHHFFEGFESPYRVDPLKLARLLELIN